MKSILHFYKEIGEYYLPIPKNYLEELGWVEGDVVNLETTIDCYPNGEVTSIIIANETKNPHIISEDGY